MPTIQVGADSRTGGGNASGAYVCPGCDAVAVVCDGVYVCFCCCGRGLWLGYGVNWPSGPRRQFQVLVRKGMGSNPILDKYTFCINFTFFLALRGILLYHQMALTNIKDNTSFNRIYLIKYP